jgi:hypothetical protein
LVFFQISYTRACLLVCASSNSTFSAVDRLWRPRRHFSRDHQCASKVPSSQHLSSFSPCGVKFA